MLNTESSSVYMGYHFSSPQNHHFTKENAGTQRTGSHPASLWPSWDFNSAPLPPKVMPLCYRQLCFELILEVHMIISSKRRNKIQTKEKRLLPLAAVLNGSALIH